MNCMCEDRSHDQEVNPEIAWGYGCTGHVIAHPVYDGTAIPMCKACLDAGHMGAPDAA